MATKHAAGTPVIGDDGKPSAEYGHFTAEQLATLEKIKDRSYKLGIAEAKYANHVLLPDGTISKDTASLDAAVRAAHKKALEGDLTKPDVLQNAAKHAAKMQEVTDHLAQKRFLFIVNEAGEPIVYFQCATAKNPDLPKKATAKDAADVEETKTRLQGLIDTSHRHAAAKRAAASPKE